MGKCKDCENWKPEQAELGYRYWVGICTSPKLEFNTNDGASAYVLDRENPNPIKDNLLLFENIKSPMNCNKSRYCFVTNETFGCLHFVKRDKKYCYGKFRKNPSNFPCENCGNYHNFAYYCKLNLNEFMNDRKGF